MSMMFPLVSRLSGIPPYILSRPSHFWFPRVYLCLDVAVTISIAIFSAHSLNRIAFTALSGVYGWIGVAFLAVLCTIGLLDCLSNDLLAKRYRLSFLYHNRWMIYMALAGVEACFIYVNVNNTLLLALMLRYLLNCAGAVMLAGFDLFERVEHLLAKEVA